VDVMISLVKLENNFHVLLWHAGSIQIRRLLRGRKRKEVVDTSQNNS
jgi:hypothetical protein